MKPLQCNDVFFYLQDVFPQVLIFFFPRKLYRYLDVEQNFLIQIQQEVRDDLSVYVLNILPKVSSLPSLLAANLVKVEMQSCDLVLVTWWKCQVSNLPSVVLCAPYLANLAPYLSIEICMLFVTWPHKTTPLRCHAYIWVRAPCSRSPPYCSKTSYTKTHYCDLWKTKVLFYWPWDYSTNILAGISLFKVNNANTRTRCEICSKLTIKTLLVNFEDISHLVLVFLLLTWNK